MSIRNNDPVAVVAIVVGALGGLAFPLAIARSQAPSTSAVESPLPAAAVAAAPKTAESPAPPTLLSESAEGRLEAGLEDVSRRIAMLRRVEGDVRARLQALPPSSPERGVETRRIIDQKANMLAEVAVLGQRIDRVTELSADRPGARGYVVGVRDIFRQGELSKKIAWSRGLVLGADQQMALEYEAVITRELDRLRSAVTTAAQAMDDAPLDP